MQNRGIVSFEDDNKAKIMGLGTIGINPSIEDVFLVSGLKFNLMSVSQLYDKNNRVIFEPTHYEVQSLHDN